MSATHVSIYGEVHGVGFRAWAHSQALKDNLSGWVRKASDGSIEVFYKEKKREFLIFFLFAGMDLRWLMSMTCLLMMGQLIIQLLALEFFKFLK